MTLTKVEEPSHFEGTLYVKKKIDNQFVRTSQKN
jgi:hypothetical protein